MAPIPVPRPLGDGNQAPPAHRIPIPFRWLVARFEFFGEEDFTVAFFFCLALFLVALPITFLLLPLVFTITGACVFVGFLFSRHIAIRRNRFSYEPSHLSKQDPSAPTPNTSSLPACYTLYVLGSGGHSAEMIETIKKSFRGGTNQHRRYVITSGDKSSAGMVHELECNIKDAFPDRRGGTFDVFEISRARAVHQPLYTAPLTCLMSAAHAVHALTSDPVLRPANTYGDQFKYPHLVVTNGPATGFIVAMAAHVLKMLCLVPPNGFKIVYTESWARSRTLSLTGKLFWWTGIAELFLVQHEPLAKKLPGSLLFSTIAAPTACSPQRAR
ncbi:glycosyltransferase [Podospora conica]|nr:glycosyltransferase [Schizothecium conicum]